MRLTFRDSPLLPAVLLVIASATFSGCATPSPAGSPTSAVEVDLGASPSAVASEGRAEMVGVAGNDVLPLSATAPTPSPPAVEPTPTLVPAAVPTSSPTLAAPPTQAPTASAVPLPTTTPLPVVAPAASPTPAPTAPALAPEVRATTRLLKKGAGEIRFADSQGLTRNGEAIELARQANGSYVAEGAFESEQHPTEFPFDNAVLSWNAETPPGTRLQFQLRVEAGGKVSPWFTMGIWDPSGGASAGGQGNAWGNVDVDTLKLANKATALQYRVAFTTSNPAVTPRLRSVAVVYSDLSTPLAGPKPAVLEGWARDLPVPQYSQLEQDPAVAREICSPTSLSMVLNFWGKGKSVREVYQGVRDARTGIFGNWPLNVAYAGSLGFNAYVDRFYSVEQLQNEIAQGRPVIISIRFGPGQLDNSPINSTTGHLIVVRGFTSEGDFIVNDPIAPKSSGVRLVYKEAQLGRVWQDSGGIVYLVRPR